MGLFINVQQTKEFPGLTSIYIKSRESWAKEQLPKYIKLSNKRRHINKNNHQMVNI
jgi:hypothetical protein